MLSIGNFGATPVVIFDNGNAVQRELSSFCEVMSADDVQRYANMLNNVHFRPVRPRSTDYDVNYYLKELASYN